MVKINTMTNGKVQVEMDSATAKHLAALLNSGVAGEAFWYDAPHSNRGTNGFCSQRRPGRLATLMTKLDEAGVKSATDINVNIGSHPVYITFKNN